MSSSGYSGTNYDRWSYEQAAKGGTLTDTPINKLQHKFWVARQAVGKKLGKEEDEHIVASDSQLDAKLELFKSINETTCRLQRLIERYQDRIYFLAGEENALGRFLKEEGKRDNTRAGKMMVAAGKTMSYTGQQRLAIRVPLVRLYQEVETFRQRAIEDMQFTVENMEKVRTQYRGALLWMKNVSTELDPDTFRQLEKFRKVQIHVRESKKRFDKLAVDCLQKIDLLAASRCNMFSHALILYQNTLVTFWEKTSKTMNHVNNGFKGYQHFQFNYIKDLAEPNRDVATKDKLKEEETKEDKERNQPDSGSLHNLLDLSSSEEKPQTQEQISHPTLDDDDEILLNIDSELANIDGSAEQLDISSIFGAGGKSGTDPSGDVLSPQQPSGVGLDLFLADGQAGPFTQEWDKAFSSQKSQAEQSEFSSQESSSNFLPSKLFELENDFKENDLIAKDRIGAGGSALMDMQPGGIFQSQAIKPMDSGNLPNISQPLASLSMSSSLLTSDQTSGSLFPQGQASNQAAASLLSDSLFSLGGHASASSQKASGRPTSGLAGAGEQSGAKGKKDLEMAEWYSLFAELDPLANPDSIGQGQNKDCL